MKHLYVVERDINFVSRLQEWLGKEFSMDVFPSVHAFENRVNRQPPDLVLVDFFLPDGSADRLVTDLKSDSLGLPVIGMSADESGRVVSCFLGAGASGFFGKRSGSMKDLRLKLKALAGLD